MTFSVGCYVTFFYLFPVYTVRCDATDRGRGEGGGCSSSLVTMKFICSTFLYAGNDQGVPIAACFQVQNIVSFILLSAMIMFSWVVRVKVCSVLLSSLTSASFWP